jgi:excisionase family DNA binding protein
MFIALGAFIAPRFIRGHRRCIVNSILADRSPVTPTTEDAELARASSAQLVKYLQKNLEIQVEDSEETILLPAAAVRLLVDLLSAMARGDAVTLIPIHSELTTQQAADLLGDSRPFLVKQLDEGKIAFRRVGTHRRVLFRDLMAYRQNMDSARKKSLDELAAQAQELDLGY